MDTVTAYAIIRQSLTATLIGSAPVLGIALAVGLVIAFVQALTQIQEMTLTFVPKLAAIGVAFWLSMGFMSDTLVAFFQGRIVPLIVGG